MDVGSTGLTDVVRSDAADVTGGCCCCRVTKSCSVRCISDKEDSTAASLQVWSRQNAYEVPNTVNGHLSLQFDEEWW
jgi:hypothetical protein